jgi:hypothetical protein
MTGLRRKKGERRGRKPKEREDREKRSPGGDLSSGVQASLCWGIDRK